ncbi:MAG: FkbM family methyltransferase [Candidatus Paceibacterota bacterium]|jgi:FkbM family methyltransferase
MRYYSQYNQDKFLDENVFKQFKNGVFLEMGADDGVVGSNTLFFERERGWSGLCIEPRKSAYEKLVKNRHCQTTNIAISSNKATTKKFIEAPGDMGQISGLVETFDKRYLDRLQKEASERGVTTTTIDVQTMTINDVLEKFRLSHIDYFSLDTEGGELEILQSIDFGRFHIECISVENPFEDKRLNNFLSNKGYKKLTRIKIDDIFILKKSIFNTYKEPLKNKYEVIMKKIKRSIKRLIGYKS